MSEQEALKKLSEEYQDAKPIWGPLVESGMKASEVLSWLEEYF